MDTFLLIVETAEMTQLGLRLTPALRLSHCRDSPAVMSMKQGAALRLRHPDGSESFATLATYGASVIRGEDGAMYISEVDLEDPQISLYVAADSPAAVPIGSEVWLRSPEIADEATALFQRD